MAENLTVEELKQKISKLEKENATCRKMEKKLQDSEQKYRSLVENIPDIIYSIDNSLKISAINLPASKFYGYRIDEILGHDFSTFIHPDDKHSVISSFIEAINTHREWTRGLQFRVISKTGIEHWVELNSHMRFDENGNFKQEEGVLRDIDNRIKTQENLQKIHRELEGRVEQRTAELVSLNNRLAKEIKEKEHTEKRLKESEEKYRRLADNAKDMIYRQAIPSGNYEYVNQAAVEITGYTPEEIYNEPMHIRKAIHPDWKDYIEKQWAKILKGEIAPFYEFQIIHKSGTIKWIYQRNVLICDENGKPMATEGIVTDISARKQAEDELKKSEEKYRMITENMAEIITVMDMDLNFTYVSPSILKLRGFTVQEAMQQTIDQIMTPESFQRVATAFADELRLEEKDTANPDRVRILELEEYKKDGSTTWVENTASFIRDKEKQPVGILVISRDITKRKELEEQLRQSHKMEAMGTLAGGIAHEFNNILGIIIGNTELAIDDVPEWNPAKHCLEEIRTASLRAKNVVRQILSIARKTPATKKQIRISSVVKESLKLIRTTIPATIELQLDMLCTSEMIHSNTTEINQILMNLCTNSVHAMENETGILKVRLENITLNAQVASQYEDLAEGEYVKLTVKDTGMGIDHRIMNRVFDPYFTTKDVDKGLGMGLAVVYGIVKKHDGAIRIDSAVGEGTTVDILFPVAHDKVEIDSKEPNDLPTGTERILLIDDEGSLVKMAKQILERHGYTVIGKTNSVEALKLFQQEPGQFDLVITDMAMPKIGGDQLAKELLRIRPTIPIVLCTGHSNRIDEARAKKIGISAYLLKPLEKKGLITTVRKVLDETKK
jgi:PAS domain S-box-containing protein